MSKGVRAFFLVLIIFQYESCLTQSTTQALPSNNTNNVFDTKPLYQPEVLKKTGGKKRKREVKWGPRMSRFFGEVFQDIFLLHKNLFTWDSLKVAVTAFPFFVSFRMIDEKLQRVFYDDTCHKNVNQLPKWCHELAKYSISVPIVFLGSDMFFAKDEEFRKTARIFLLGLPFVIFTKNLIKKLEFEICLRPWHEDFSCVKRSHGGFPSGHLAEATYVAVLYGMRFGSRYAVPLSALAVFVGSVFLTCNRHYASQLVAGAGFGAMYALAANKLIDSRLAENAKIGLGMNQHGPAVSLSYCF